MTDKKKDSGWRKRVSGSVNQIGQAFPIEPHGDKSKLPRSLQQVSPVNEISEALEKRRKKNMSPEEAEEDEIINQIIQDEIEEQLETERRKNLLNKLSDALDKHQKRAKLRKVLEDAKEDADTGKDDGYEEQSDRLKTIQDANDSNEVFG